MKFHNRRRRISGPQANDSSQVMSLALFIMLLAFFIVLNALSTQEERKAKPIMKSIEKAFSTEIRPYEEDSGPSEAEDPYKAIHEGDMVERLDALFTAQIASFEAEKDSRRGTMHVSMPVEAFSKAILAIGQVALTPQNSFANAPKSFFLPTLVSMLKSAQKSQPYRMDITLHVKTNPGRLQNQEPESVQKAIARVSSFAQHLEKAGLPQRFMNIGLAEGDESIIDLDFRPHIPFSPIEKMEETAP